MAALDHRHVITVSISSAPAKTVAAADGAAGEFS